MIADARVKKSQASTPEVLISFKGRCALDFPALEKLTALRIREFARALKLSSEHELSVVLCDSTAIRRINRRWRGKDKATDVLSFPQQQLKPGSGPRPGAIGDIIIALPVTRREAREFGLTFEDHFSHLLLHGLLHLLGYDHVKERDARVMESLERRMLGRK